MSAVVASAPPVTRPLVSYVTLVWVPAVIFAFFVTLLPSFVSVSLRTSSIAACTLLDEISPSGANRISDAKLDDALIATLLPILGRVSITDCIFAAPL